MSEELKLPFGITSVKPSTMQVRLHLRSHTTRPINSNRTLTPSLSLITLLQQQQTIAESKVTGFTIGAQKRSNPFQKHKEEAELKRRVIEKTVSGVLKLFFKTADTGWFNDSRVIEPCQ